ncbi:MAG: hypothetical protein JWP81_745 [Ferruginibacter sp.]|nr:hypothetical protein [Ferruginibacter sp.]
MSTLFTHDFAPGKQYNSYFGLRSAGKFFNFCYNSPTIPITSIAAFLAAIS